MSRRRPFFAVDWDAQSDQPHRVKDAALRRQLRAEAAGEGLKTALTALAAAPFLAVAYGRCRAEPRPVAGLASLAVSPVPPAQQQALAEALAELACPRLQVRWPLWDRRQQEAVLALVASQPQADWLLVVPQDRIAVCRPAAWVAAIEDLCRRLPPAVRTLQLGNAVNRLKWGCATIGEYLQLLDLAVPICRQQTGVQLAGSAIIDFEVLPLLRSLLHRHPARLEVCASLLYVDRRGAPTVRQYGVFDLECKIRLWAAALRLSRRVAPRLWLSECNWPLAGHGAWAPTSPKECVDEATAADYLRQYLQISAATGLVERVYFWQLAARGYGLIDPRDWRRRPAFGVLRAALAGQLEPAGRPQASAV